MGEGPYDPQQSPRIARSLFHQWQKGMEGHLYLQQSPFFMFCPVASRICQTGNTEVRTLAQIVHIFPLVGGTIDTHVSPTFVVMTGASQMRTGNIEENVTNRA